MKPASGNIVVSDMIDNVHRLMRIASAIAVALAVAAFPLIADWCAVACEAVHTSIADTAPACHHAATATPRIGEIPEPCSHEHHPIVVDAATTTAVAARAALTAALPQTSALETASSSALVARWDVAATSSPPIELTLATILRI